jgi:hypothetical protein
MSRLVEAAQTDPFAFDACHALWRLDQQREGMPNWQLRQWGASYPQRPSAKGKPNPRHRRRDIALMWLIADAATLGFDPYKNLVTRSGEPSACDVVVAALRHCGFSGHHLPTVAVLEHAWGKYKHLRPWLPSENQG